MRVSFYQRRRTPGLRLYMRAGEEAAVDVPVGDKPVDEGLPTDELPDDESSDDELSSDEEGESSDEEDEEEDDDEDEESDEPIGSGIPRPTENASPSTSLGPSPTTTSQPLQETATSSFTDMSSASSPLASSSGIPVPSTSIIPILNPGGLATSTSALPQSTGGAKLDGPTEVPQSNNAVNPSNGNEGSGSSNNSQRAGQIAGGTIGSIAFVGLILFAIWMWRRRRNQNNHRLSGLSGMPPEDARYDAPEPQDPGYARTPSSIMNQLMTAAYAAEDGRNYRDSEQAFDNYASEKQRFTAYGNESTERLTVPAAAQMRPPSIAARTETTNRTESTWKTWGVLAGSSRPPAPKNWWVDRYLRA